MSTEDAQKMHRVSKADRHSAILRTITEHNIDTQEQLAVCSLTPEGVCQAICARRGKA